SNVVARKPGIHERNLSFLRRDDIFGQLTNFRITPILDDDLCHIDCALVMRDHRADEIDVDIARHGNGLDVCMSTVTCSSAFEPSERFDSATATDAQTAMTPAVATA